MNEQDKLLKRIAMYKFCCLEARMFLDTHPDDAQAISYFNRNQGLLSAAMKAYTEKYGPLSYTDESPQNRFDWVNGPWPWEAEANVEL